MPNIYSGVEAVDMDFQSAAEMELDSMHESSPKGNEHVVAAGVPGLRRKVCNAFKWKELAVGPMVWAGAMVRGRGLTPTFSNLSSPTIAPGTPSAPTTAHFSGTIAANPLVETSKGAKSKEEKKWGETVPATGMVRITVKNARNSTVATIDVTIDGDGNFSADITRAWAAGTYTVTYQYLPSPGSNFTTTDKGSSTFVVSSSAIP